VQYNCRESDLDEIQQAEQVRRSAGRTQDDMAMEYYHKMDTQGHWECIYGTKAPIEIELVSVPIS
jgi:hypothetical protein